MKKYKKVMKNEVSDIICDICNQTCVKFQDDPGCSEFATLEAYWGYWSKKDGEKYHCEMCEDCFDKVVKFIDSIHSGSKI